jgi:CheY-like chemotaxis protein
MRILIVEDQKERITCFNFQLVGHVVESVDKPKDAIALLAEKEWDCLFLDHDLEGPWICPSGPGTGYEVACWLEAHPARQPKVIITHTFNVKGAEKICQALPNALYFRSCWQNSKLKDTIEALHRGS